MSIEDLETPKTFTLLSPITTSAGELSEITLREPTAGDIEQLQRDEAKDGAATALVKLIAKQAKLPPVDVRNIGARDFNKLQEYLGSFLPQVP